MTNIITIDGPAASGKGTLARRLAAHLDYFYLDTGKIYRLVGLKVLSEGIKDPSEDIQKTVDVAKNLAADFDLNLLYDDQLKSDTAGTMASLVGPIQPMRDAVLALQRTLAHTPPTGQKGSVLDGRDCGTVIAPDAAHKFYVIADVETRAQRRFKELQNNGLNPDFETVLADMKARDARDMARGAAPMKPADDAVIIDTTTMTADEAFAVVLKTVEA